MVCRCQRGEGGIWNLCFSMQNIKLNIKLYHQKRCWCRLKATHLCPMAAGYFKHHKIKAGGLEEQGLGGMPATRSYYLGQHDQRETENVAKRQQDERHASCNLALPILVADEHRGGHKGRCSEHHGNVEDLHNGDLDVVFHLACPDLRASSRNTLQSFAWEG